VRYRCPECGFEDEDRQVVVDHETSHFPAVPRFRVVDERTGQVVAEASGQDAAVERASAALSADRAGRYRIDEHDVDLNEWTPVLSIAGYG
jgi:hypothetical protein